MSYKSKENYHEYRRDIQLGQTHAGAMIKLRKLLLFEFAKRLGLLNCIRCGEPILTEDDFTIDHKKEWFDVEGAETTRCETGHHASSQ